jgi:hypothetical protein
LHSMGSFKNLSSILFDGVIFGFTFLLLQAMDWGVCRRVIITKFGKVITIDSKIFFFFNWVAQRFQIRFFSFLFGSSIGNLSDYFFPQRILNDQIWWRESFCLLK